MPCPVPWPVPCRGPSLAVARHMPWPVPCRDAVARPMPWLVPCRDAVARPMPWPVPSRAAVRPIQRPVPFHAVARPVPWPVQCRGSFCAVARSMPCPSPATPWPWPIPFHPAPSRVPQKFSKSHNTKSPNTSQSFPKVTPKLPISQPLSPVAYSRKRGGNPKAVQTYLDFPWFLKAWKVKLRGRELNPGLPRDRRKY